jgi:6-phosphogluconolactonase
VVVGADTADAVERAAEIVTELLSQSIHEPPGTASVALAGGGTPAALYRRLTETPYRDRVDWKAVDWFWGDERAVPPDHEDSNYRMACDTLLRPLEISPDRIHRMPADEENLCAAAERYETIVRERVGRVESGVPAIDLVLLGVGGDGHTASLFPGSTALNETRRLIAETRVPSLDVWRMTMTYPLLRAARQILFLVTGSGKAEVMAKLLSAGNDSEFPSAALRDGSTPIMWILDADAARLVQPELRT